jgi:Flp pilus assembly protein TadG
VVLVRTERGSVLVEMVAACLLLTIFFFICAGTWFLVQDKLSLERVARDGAREAVIVGDIDKGRQKAEDRAEQFFGKRAGDVDIHFESIDDGTFHARTCVATYPHKLFGFGTEVTLRAEATYGWKDTAD